MEKHTGYHGTDEVRYEKINKEGFVKTQSVETLPCDLGRGIYFFIKRNERDKPNQHAMRYVKKYKNRYTKPVVIAATCHVDSDNILDFNDSDNADSFNEFREKNYVIIKNQLKNFFPNKTYYRGNLDGLVLEVMLDTLSLKPDAIIKDTFTPIEDIGADYKRSNFPNAREMCVRNERIIKNMCIAK